MLLQRPEERGGVERTTKKLQRKKRLYGELRFKGRVWTLENIRGYERAQKEVI